MRILLSTDTVGGVWDHSLTLAAALIERGHRVMLAVIGRADRLRDRSLPAGVELRCRDFPLEWMPGAGGSTEPAARWLAELAREWRADVAHLNQMAYSARDTGIPTVVVAHSDVLSWFSEVRGERPGPEWDGYTARVREGLLGADVVAAPSRYQAGLLERHFGRRVDRVVHNGTHVPAPAAPPTRERVVISAGRAWDQAKGMALLDRALVLLGEDAPAAHVFGSLSQPGGTSFHASRLRCEGNVPPERLGEWMERAAVYVGASLYEPFGLAPLEAALHGCPLVLSDIGSFRELWDGCAIFFRCGSADALADTLRDALADPELTTSLAEAARERARTHYSVNAMTEGYLALYRDAMATRGAGAARPATRPPVQGSRRAARQQATTSNHA